MIRFPEKSKVICGAKDALDIFDVYWVGSLLHQIEFEPELLDEISHIRIYINEIAEGDIPVYGINTGFGALAETHVPKEVLNRLQHNLVRSHAVGVGEPLEPHVARMMMLLRLNTLCHGGSGVRPQLLEHLQVILNAGIAPYVPSRGSVGASGDLAPLAHIVMLLTGEGKGFYKGELTKAEDILKDIELAPLELQAKEGLALINGTQAMTAVGTSALVHSLHLLDYADMTAALSIDALLGSVSPFDARIHRARPHPGQIYVAENLRYLLDNSPLRSSHTHCDKVQDPYSLRCVPQVHGATRDIINQSRKTIECEIGSITDNPIVFTKNIGGTDHQAGYDIISGGNFHGQPIAYALDFMAIAMSEIANMSERRIEQLLNPSLSSGLPAFLSPNPGLNSGLMMLQVTAASLVNENKILCHPASVDSIPSSASREDHVSMGMTSANKLLMILKNVQTVIAIEWICASQAVDLRKTKSSEALMHWQKYLRTKVELFTEDRYFGDDLHKAIELLDLMAWDMPQEIQDLIKTLNGADIHETQK